MELICPKCQAPMRQYERSGITIDQCTECRGIFLDRGELERLVDAETSWHGQGAPAPTPAAPAPAPHRDYDRDYDRSHDRGYDPGYRRDYDDRGHYGHKPHKKKKRSFLEDLFDD